MNFKKIDKELARIKSRIDDLDPAIELLKNNNSSGNVTDLIFFFQDIESISKFLQNYFFDILVESEAENEFNWYLYSIQKYRLNNDAGEALQLAQKSIDIIVKKNETVAAISKNYIELAIKSGKAELAKLEYQRIVNLTDMTSEKSSYLLGNLSIQAKSYIIN